MDFKRVERIFLVVFLCLNVFLYYIYQEGKVEQKELTKGTISDNIEKRLQADNINLPHTLSKSHEQGYYLSAEESKFLPDIKEVLTNQEWQVNDSKLSATMLNSATLTISDDDEEGDIKTFVSKESNIFNGSEFYLIDYETQKGVQYTFGQAYEGIPFFDETSQLTINLLKDGTNNIRIEGYDQTYLENIEALRDPQSLISEREAIISLYTNNSLQSGNDIKWIELGYTRIFTVREKNIYIPAWFVGVETSKNNIKVEKVNAFLNTIISSNVSEVKK